MSEHGQLFVFEGADGVGKSTLAARFAELLIQRGIPHLLLSFPGKEQGSVGKLVYDIHHSPDQFNVSGISGASLQLLHIAAHLDAIERMIVPALRSGTSVVLDRFWWSTKVYGLASGVGKRLLDRMIDVEIAAWGTFRPTRIILVEREKPLRPEPIAEWRQWSALYETISREQGMRTNVVRLENNGSLQDATDGLALVLTEVEQETTARRVRQTRLDLRASREPTAPTVFSALSPAKPSPVYDTYWRFAAERQEIFFKRFEKATPPWTSDPILTEFKFTNAYRASDRVSQYLIRNVLYDGDQSEEELFFRTILFKLFNKIETWELLQRWFGVVTYRDFDPEAYDNVLLDALGRGDTIYSAAYIMPSGSSVFGTSRKHQAHLMLLESMMADELPLRIADAKNMLEVFTLLRSYPTIGGFLAYQYVTDLNYSALVNFTEQEFVVPGPGAKSGIAKCFRSLGGLSETDIIQVVAERQHAEFERLGIDFKSLWGRPLQLIDCQNLFCEVDKYARVYHPEIEGGSGRKRIKQKFRPSNACLTYWYPPKWGLNEKINQEQEEVSP